MQIGWQDQDEVPPEGEEACLGLNKVEALIEQQTGSLSRNAKHMQEGSKNRKFWLRSDWSR